MAVVDKHHQPLMPSAAISWERVSIEYRLATLFEYEIREYLLENYIRAPGYFTIQTATDVIQGGKSQDRDLVQHADEHYYLNNLSNQSPQQIEEQRFPPVLKGQVFALSIG